MRSSLVHAIRTRAQSAYAHITLNRVTTAFFIFSFIHCFVQGIIQSLLFSIDAEYSSILSGIVSKAAISPGNTTYLEGSSGNFDLRICYDIPHGQSPYPCSDIFRSAVDARTSINGSRTLNPSDGFVITSHRDNSTLGNTPSVTIISGDRSVILSKQCTQIMLYPQQIMKNSKREDVTFVFLQFWLFAISVIAVMYDSVPHTLAVLITRGLITAWSIYAIWRTKYLETVFHELVNDPGTPCHVDVFPTYFKTRISYEIPDLILNCTALFIACYLSWTLLRVYNAQSFKCVGAPEHINRINKFFMAVLACLQLEAFVLVTAMGLWIDVLVNTAISRLSEHTTVYIALIVGTTILDYRYFYPGSAWRGWYAIRREMKRVMMAFLLIAFLILSAWSIMFYSIVYRWSFIQWPYLGCYTVASLVLIIAGMVLGIICRLNFDKGLAQYLHAEEALASSNFAPGVFAHDVEKSPMDIDPKSPEQLRPTFYLPDSQQHRQSAIIAFHLPPVASELGRPQLPSAPYTIPYNVPF